MRITRMLPYPGRVAVRLGDPVIPDSLIAETTLQPEEPVHLSITEIFGIAPHRIHEVIKVEQGDFVEQRQILAKSDLFGQPIELESPGAGCIEQISPLLGTISLRLEGDPHERLRRVNIAEELGMPVPLAMQCIRVTLGEMVRLGQLLATDIDQEIGAFAPMHGRITAIENAVISIERPFVRTQILAFLAGRIVEIFPSWGAVVESDMQPWQGMFGLGGEVSGSLKLLVERREECADAASIDAAAAGRVVVAGALASKELLLACKQHGVAGVVAGGAHNLDLIQLQGEEIAPGAASLLGFSLLLSEGMGRIPMNDALFSVLQRCDNRTVSLNGLTQIRAGVIRPCLYLPEGIASEREEPVSDRDLEGKTEDIVIGNRIRIIREPWFGIVGVVKALSGPETLPSGVRTLTYAILTESGESLRVARSNVEKLTQ